MRRGRAAVLESVLSSLAQGTLNTAQIASATSIRWETVDNALRDLEAIGLVKRVGKEYMLTQSPPNPHAIMHLPLTLEQEKGLCELANRVVHLSDRQLNKTFLQKIVVGVIRKCNLDLPWGWYLYGPCTAHRFEETRLREFGQMKDCDVIILQVLDEFRQFKNTVDLMKTIYTAENRQAYQTRLLLDQLFKQEFTSTNLDIILDEIKKLLFIFAKEINDDTLLSYTQALYSTFIRLQKLPLPEIEMLRMSMFDAFSSIWELYGSANMYLSSKDYFEVDPVSTFDSRKETIAGLAEQKILGLQEFCPPIVLDEKTSKLRDTLAR